MPVPGAAPSFEPAQEYNQFHEGLLIGRSGGRPRSALRQAQSLHKGHLHPPCEIQATCTFAKCHVRLEDLRDPPLLMLRVTLTVCKQC